MNKQTRNATLTLLALALQITVEAASHPSDQAQPSPTINVRIFNYAGVSNADFTKAQKEASRIFRRSGIQVNWIECEAVKSSAANPRCTAKTNEDDIILRILPREMVAAKRHSEFGVALVPPNGGFGKYASIYFARVEEYADRWQASAGLLLGHLAAHELGHLLLGVNSHADSGIMNVPWSRGKLERASLGTLLFTPREATKMQRQVSERIAANGSRGMADEQ